jgi:septum formation protein
MMNKTPSIWSGKSPLVLASKSPARRALLDQAGLAPLTHGVAFDERAFEQDQALDAMKPARRAIALSHEKARLAASDFPGHYVIGADQILSCEDKVFHKASNRMEAIEQLFSLAGKTHHLLSASAVFYDGKMVFEACDEACLTMRQLSREEITRYLSLAGDDVLGNVGCYALEGIGVNLFEKIEGDFFTILGLPLQKLLGFFRKQGCLSL